MAGDDWAAEAPGPRAFRSRRVIPSACGRLGRSIEEDGVVGPATLAAVKTAAWALGAVRATLQRIDRGEIPIGSSG